MQTHDVTSRTALLAAGVTSNEIQRRVRAGQWTRLRTGIYATCREDAREPWLLTFAGEICWGGSRAALSHRAAAFLYGLDGFLVPSSPDIVVPAASACRGDHVHRTQFELPTVMLFELPVVTPEVCLTQLGHVVSEHAVEAALESALRHGITTVERLQAFIDSPLGRIDGGKAMRALLRRRPPTLPPTSSHLETSVVQIMRGFGFRGLERHVGLGPVTVSLASRKQRLAVSCAPGSRSLLPDDVHERLLDQGWTVVRITQAEFAANERAVVETIRAAIVASKQQTARQRRLSRLAQKPPVRKRRPRAIVNRQAETIAA